jgi:hypothetical protein
VFNQDTDKVSMAAGILSVAPRKKENFDRERIEIRAEGQWIAKVTAEAERLGLSLSAYVRLAVNERLERTQDAKRARRSRSED